MSDQDKGREVVAWEGEVDGDYYRVVGHDDSYGGTAWAIEWAAVDPETLETIWEAVSYGDEADAPECASVAAHIAAALDQAEAQEIRLNESLAESETELRGAEHRVRELKERIRDLDVETWQLQGQLDRLLPVVQEALRARTRRLTIGHNWNELHAALDALLPEDRAWAEGGD